MTEKRQVEQLPIVKSSVVLAARPGTEITIAVTAEILEGWAIQAHSSTLPYLIPTVLSFEPAPDISFGEVVYSEPMLKKAAFAKEELLVYTGLAVFLSPLKLLSLPRRGRGFLSPFGGALAQELGVFGQGQKKRTKPL